MTRQSTPLDFTSASGDRLAAVLDLPVRGVPRAYALFAHCFTCGKDLKALHYISRVLTAHGIAVMRFDFTGLGASDGEFAASNFSSNVADLVAAADHLASHHAAPQLLIGHSLGGTAALAAAGRIESVRAVATIGAPFDPAHVIHHFSVEHEQIERQGEAEVRLGGRPFKIRRQLIDDLNGQRLEAAIHRLGRALLIFHSPVDATVPIENAARIYAAALHPKSFVTLDDADHLLTDTADASYVGTVVAAWAVKYVDALAAAPSDLRSGEQDVVVRIGGSGFFTEIDAGGHTLVADEPVGVGGTDLGPSPYQLLNAALGACTAMTLRMYADRKGLPLEGVEVRLEHAKRHARDCAECPDSASKVDVIDREIALRGPLDVAMRSRLLEIADRCPVHRSLHEPVVVRSRLAAEE